jgi:hypothetical protein
MAKSSETSSQLQNDLALKMSELRLVQQKLADQKLKADDLEQQSLMFQDRLNDI